MGNDIKDRINYIDIAKGICIILVIIGHMNIWKFNKFIYSFHMPLFFVLAGAFISQKYSNAEYIKKKAKQLLIPYVFTCVVLVTLSIVGNLIKGTVDNIGVNIQKWFAAAIYGSGNLEKYGFTRIGAIWFLLAIFMACVFVRFISDKRGAVLYVILVSVAGYLTSEIVWLPLSIQPAMVASAYVYIGYVARKENILNKEINGSLGILIVMMWILTIIFGEINTAKNLYKYGIFSFVGSLCGVYVVLKTCKIVDDRKIMPHAIVKILCFYGKNSLIILCFHLIELEEFPWSSFRELFLNAGGSNWLFLILEFFIKILFATCAVFIVQRIGFFGKIFNTKK